MAKLSRQPRGNRRNSLLARITINPRVCGGRPCVRDTRVRVLDVLELLAARMNTRQIIRQLPYLEAEDITACLSYAASCMDHPKLVA